MADENQLNRRGNDDQPESLAFRCAECSYRSSTAELLEGHQVNRGHSAKSEETFFDRWRQKLTILTSNARDFCVATTNLVEEVQAERGHSGGHPYVICMADLIKFYCENVGSVGPEDILISTGEIFNSAEINQPQVVPEFLFNPQSIPKDFQIRRGPQRNRVAVGTGLNGEISPPGKIVEELLRREEIHKSPVVVVRGKFGSFQCHSDAKKSARKRLKFHLIPTRSTAHLPADSSEAQADQSQNESELDQSGDIRDETFNYPDESDTERLQLGPERSAEKESRRKVIRKTSLVVRSKNLSASPTAIKSAQKRPVAALNAAGPAVVFSAKRNKIDSTSNGTSHEGAVRQANCLTGRTELQVNSAGKQLGSVGADGVIVGSVAVGKSDSSDRRERQSSERDEVCRSISTLSNRFANLSPSELLSDLIGLMSSRMEDDQVQWDGHRLIDQYSVEQLNTLEPTVKRRLVELLLSLLKDHNGPQLIQKSLDLLLKMGVDNRELDCYLDAIETFLELAECLTDAGRKSVLRMLIAVASHHNAGEINWCGQSQFVEKIFHSIRRQLDQPDYDEVMQISWYCLGVFCSKSAENRQRFLDAWGIKLFRRCYKKFPRKVRLVRCMTHLMMLLSKSVSTRQHLMASQCWTTLMKIWTTTEDSQTSQNCFAIFNRPFFARQLSKSRR